MESLLVELKDAEKVGVMVAGMAVLKDMWMAESSGSLTVVLTVTQRVVKSEKLMVGK